MRIALVGVAHIHTPLFVEKLLKHHGISLKWVWDHQSKRAEKTAAQLGSKATDNLGLVMSDPEVTGIIICSETNRHEQLVVAGANAGKHMFVEKPLGLKAADLEAMQLAIEQSGVIFQTGYFMRGDPINIFLRDQIKAGSFGQITRIRHSSCHAGALDGFFDSEWSWIADLEQSGVGGFGDLGLHSLDLILWMMNDEVEAVTASIQSVVGRYKDCDEYGEGVIQFKNGAIGAISAGWVDVSNPLKLVINGTKGNAYIAAGQLYFHSKEVTGADGKEPWIDLPDSLPHAFDLFLDALVGAKNIPLIKVSEAVRGMTVMNALYEGARQKKWIYMQQNEGQEVDS